MTILFLIMALTLDTINNNGIAELPKWQTVFNSLLASNFDIFFLQETHLAHIAQGKMWERQDGSLLVVSRYKSVSRCGHSN